MNSKRIFLRRVLSQDKKLLFNWVNDPSVRRSAYNKAEISWEEHEEWFDESLKSSNTVIFIAMLEDNPIGQIRFEKEKGEVVVDVSVSREYRGNGYGSVIIKGGAEKLRDVRSDWTKLHAWIKENNTASKHSFEKAGYNLKEIADHEGYESAHYVYCLENH